MTTEGKYAVETRGRRRGHLVTHQRREGLERKKNTS